MPPQAFDDCTTIGASFKLFESFEGLVERDAISADLQRKHADLIGAFLLELQEVGAQLRPPWWGALHLAAALGAHTPG